MADWHQDWFNQDYIKLYAHRDADEALEHVAFVKQATGLESGRVLDLGCGMGRHAIILADDGFDVVGVDASAVLLQEAKKQGDGRSIQWLQADFRALPELGLFDLILSMFTSFGYFNSDKENALVLGVVSKYLKSSGFFFLDFLNPNHVIDNLVEKEQKEIEGQNVVITRSVDDGAVVKTIHFPGKNYTERVRLYNKDQIVRMAAGKGLKLKGFWTGYESQSADRQLFLFSL